MEALEPQVPIGAGQGGGCRIHLYARPRASRTQVAGLHGARVKLQVAAPPVDGAANEAITAFLSDALGVAKGEVVWISGERGKRKTVEVAGVTPAAAAEALGLDWRP